MIVYFGEPCFEIFHIGVDVRGIVDFPDFDFRGCVALDGVDRDKSTAVFSPKVEFDREAIPTGCGNTVGFVKYEVMLSVVVLKIENSTAVLKIQGGLCIVMVGDMYLFGEMSAVFKGGGDR